MQMREPNRRHQVASLSVQKKVEEVEHMLYGEQRAKEEAAKRAALEERLAKRAAEREKIDRAKDWSEEEVRMLEKALDKFPPVCPSCPRAVPLRPCCCSYDAHEDPVEVLSAAIACLLPP